VMQASTLSYCNKPNPSPIVAAAMVHVTHYLGTLYKMRQPKSNLIICRKPLAIMFRLASSKTSHHRAMVYLLHRFSCLAKPWAATYSNSSPSTFIGLRHPPAENLAGLQDSLEGREVLQAPCEAHLLACSGSTCPVNATWRRNQLPGGLDACQLRCQHLCGMQTLLLAACVNSDAYGPDIYASCPERQNNLKWT